MPIPENLAHIARCHHIKDDGVRCGSPALRGKKLCFFHDRQRKTFPRRRPYRTAQFCRRADFFNVRTPDDVMIALNQVMNALLRNQLSPDEARSIVFALQTASTFAPDTTAARTQYAQTPVGAAPFPAGEGALPPDHPMTHAKSVAEIFEMFPGCEDLKAMLTPQDIAALESTMTPR